MKQTLALSIALSLGVQWAAAAEPISAAQFDRLHALIKPHAGEDKWADIQWRTDLWQARKEAAEKGKPILLWEMDGHPLGCV